MRSFNPVEIVTLFKKTCWYQYDLMRVTEHDHYTDNSIDHYNQKHAEGSIWAHTCMVCSNIIQRVKNPSLEIFLAGLLHDVAKTLTIDTKLVERNDEKFLVNTFYSHQNVGVFLAIDCLKNMFGDQLLAQVDVRRVLELVQFHMFFTFDNKSATGADYKLSEDKIKMINSAFAGRRALFVDILDLSICDSLGRFTDIEDYYSAIARDKYLRSLLDQFVYVEKKKEDSAPTFTMLIGPAGSGKTTHRNKLEETKLFRTISFDDYIENKTLDLNLDYREVFSSRPDILKEAEENVNRNLVQAIRNEMDIVVDMTNLSKKSRNKKLNFVPDKYKKKAIVFLRGYEDLRKTDVERAKIKRDLGFDVRFKQLCSFSFPTDNYFDEVRVMLDGREI